MGYMPGRRCPVARYAVALVIALLLNASANLMIKFGMHAINAELAGQSILAGGPVGVIKLVLRHWILLAGLGCFALNVVFYSFALQKLQISVAYPIMVTVGFAIIAAVAGWKLGDGEGQPRPIHSAATHSGLLV